MKHLKPYRIFESQEESEHPGFPNSEEEINKICKNYDIRNYTINNDLSIDVDGHVLLREMGLKYLPLKFNYVSGYFDCAHNGLISLKGCPKEISGYFNCYLNSLKTLEHSPKMVGGGFYCHKNILKSLKGCPEIINTNFYCNDNELKTLEYSPKQINETIDLSNNYIESLEYFPNIIGEILIYSNPIYKIINTFIESNNSEDLVQEFNEYDIVRGDKVVLDRLRAFCSDFDLAMPNIELIKEDYKIV